MKNENSLRNQLISEVMEVRSKIESSSDNLPKELGILKILSDADAELNNSVPDKNQLEKIAYGIFRLVSESYELERSPLGQELLSLRKKIRDLVSTIHQSK